MQETKPTHNEWMQKILSASSVTPEETGQETPVMNEKPAKFNKSSFILFAILFLLAFIPRVYFIYFMSAPENGGVGWNGDTYHHWQIGYLTYTTGLQHGFLRLWDLKGMEYFWGPFDPLLLTVIFALTGNVNLVITRLLSTFFGVASLLLLALLAKRYWGTRVAVLTFLFGMFFPIAIQSDASGMLEPFGVFFMLLGIYFWPSLPIVTGVSWALGTMVRAEAWLFSIGLLVGLFFVKEKAHKKGLVLIGWVTVMLVYMKYLLDNTGNAIYPVYWNFLANGLGSWADPSQQLTPLQLTVQPILMTLGVLTAFVLLFLLYKKPKGLLLLLLGFGNIFFVTAFIGFSHYIKGWEWWFPLIRFFVFSYIFLAMVLFAILSQLEKHSSKMATTVLIVGGILIIVVSQLTWGPVIYRFSQTAPEWQRSMEFGKEVGKYYQSGTLLFPEGDPNLTYAVVAYGHVNGKNILGEMFDPFYYIGEKEAFINWDKYEVQINSWFKKYNIQLMVIPNDRGRYFNLIKKEQFYFEKIEQIPNSTYQLWKVYPDRIPSL